MSLKSVIVGVLVFFLVGSPMMLVSAQPPTFHVPVLRNPVTLDGVISGDEWADANRMDVTFERDGLAYQGWIWLKHDCVNLWMCIEVIDDDEEKQSPGPGLSGDLVGILFDANGNWMTGAGDDMAILAHKDYPLDLAYTADPPAPPVGDDTVGGVNNVMGKSGYILDKVSYTFELSKPLNSGDSAGNDIAISPGDEILAIFIYYDPGETLESPPYVGFILSLAPCFPVGGTVIQTDHIGLRTPLWVMFSSAVAVVSIAIITHKRREAQIN